MIDSQPIKIDFEALSALAIEAGNLALTYFGRVSAEQKADRSLVSVADQAVEQFLADHLGRRYPQSAILGEESGSNNIQSDHLWVLDPIDGTAAFLGSFPVWGVSIGYMFKHEPIAGLFYLPVSRDLFFGNQHYAQCNTDGLPALTPHSIDSHSLLLVPSNTHRKYEINFIGKTRSLGSVAAHLCYLAAGKAVGVLLGQISLWDIAGVWPLLQAVGGVAYTLDGRPFELKTLIENKKAQQPLLVAPEWYIEDLVKSITLKSSLS